MTCERPEENPSKNNSSEITCVNLVQRSFHAQGICQSNFGISVTLDKVLQEEILEDRSMMSSAERE
jgi:hypothetical protein